MAEQFWIPFKELAHQRGVQIESETGYGRSLLPAQRRESMWGKG